jgi:hypothetical protein
VKLNVSSAYTDHLTYVSFSHAPSARIYRHAGNQKFLKLVREAEATVRFASRSDRTAAADGVVAAIKGWAPPGRFLERVSNDGEEEIWREVGDAAARRKVLEAFREARRYKPDTPSGEVPTDLFKVSSAPHRRELPGRTGRLVGVILTSQSVVPPSHSLLVFFVASKPILAHSQAWCGSPHHGGVASTYWPSHLHVLCGCYLLLTHIPLSRQSPLEPVSALSLDASTPDASALMTSHSQLGGSFDPSRLDTDESNRTAPPIDQNPMHVSITRDWPRGVAYPPHFFRASWIQYDEGHKGDDSGQPSGTFDKSPSVRF